MKKFVVSVPYAFGPINLIQFIIAAVIVNIPGVNEMLIAFLGMPTFIALVTSPLWVDAGFSFLKGLILQFVAVVKFGEVWKSSKHEQKDVGE